MGFDSLILLLQKSPNFLMASFLVILLEAILKEITIVVAGFEKHFRKSERDSSLLLKLTKYLFINSGLLVFLSSYNLGSDWILGIFSTGQFHEASPEWYLSVGLSLQITFIVQIFYVNLRPLLERIKYRVFKKIL